MLYIKFNIEDRYKFEDFKKIYKHMVMVRQPDFKFDDKGPDFDWDSMKEEEVDIALIELNNFLDQQAEPEKYRCKELFPSYVNEYIKDFFKEENNNIEQLGNLDTLSIFNYLEYGFEVDMSNLKKINQDTGIVEFSTGNYPFGGLDRFIITLAAYNLKPIMCFDGFNKCEITWNSLYQYNLNILPKTE